MENQQTGRPSDPQPEKVGRINPPENVKKRLSQQWESLFYGLLLLSILKNQIFGYIIPIPLCPSDKKWPVRFHCMPSFMLTKSEISCIEESTDRREFLMFQSFYFNYKPDWPILPFLIGLAFLGLEKGKLRF